MEQEAITPTVVVQKTLHNSLKLKSFRKQQENGAWNKSECLQEKLLTKSVTAYAESGTITQATLAV